MRTLSLFLIFIFLSQLTHSSELKGSAENLKNLSDTWFSLDRQYKGDVVKYLLISQLVKGEELNSPEFKKKNTAVMARISSIWLDQLKTNFSASEIAYLNSTLQHPLLVKYRKLNKELIASDKVKALLDSEFKSKLAKSNETKK